MMEARQVVWIHRTARTVLVATTVVAGPVTTRDTVDPERGSNMLPLFNLLSIIIIKLEVKTIMLSFNDLGIKKQTAILDNGDQLLHFKRANSVFSVAIAFLSGALYQPQNKPGLAHFVEHMLAKESKSYPDLLKLKEEFMRTASYINAFTGLEMLYLFASIPDSSSIRTILNIMVDQLNNPLLLDERIEKERGAIQQEIRMRENNYSLMNYCQLLNLMISTENNFIDPVVGSVEQIKEINKKDIAGYYGLLKNQTKYVISCGDIDIEELKEYFSLVFAKPNKLYRPKLKLETSTRRVVITPLASKQDNVFINLGIKINKEENIKNQSIFYILDKYLASSQKSKLLEILRYDLGLVYGVNSSYQTFGELAFFQIGTEAKKESLPKVLDVLQTEIGKIAKGDIDGKHLGLIKQMVQKQTKRFFQNSENIVNMHLSHATNQDFNDHIEMVNKIKRVTKKDLQRVARDFLDKEDLLWSFSGNLLVKDISFLINVKENKIAIKT